MHCIEEETWTLLYIHTLWPKQPDTMTQTHQDTCTIMLISQRHGSSDIKREIIWGKQKEEKTDLQKIWYEHRHYNTTNEEQTLWYRQTAYETQAL